MFLAVMGDFVFLREFFATCQRRESLPDYMGHRNKWIWRRCDWALLGNSKDISVKRYSTYDGFTVQRKRFCSLSHVYIFIVFFSARCHWLCVSEQHNKCDFFSTPGNFAIETLGAVKVLSSPKTNYEPWKINLIAVRVKLNNEPEPETESCERHESDKLKLIK